MTSSAKPLMPTSRRTRWAFMGPLAMVVSLFFSLEGRSAEDTTAGILNAPKAFRAAADIVLPSVVTIESFGGTQPGTRPNPGAGRGRSRRGRRGRPRRPAGGISKPGEGPTTGLIISADGWIVTSTFNFIRKQPIITVILDDGTQHIATLKGRDDTRKICLLKVEGVTDFPVPKHLSPSALKVGQWAVSVGVGFGGDEAALSSGIISATRRMSGRAIQTDANISPANYGGPLIDIEGNVLGICVPLSPRAQGEASGVDWYDSGIGFAIPLSGAKRLIEEMKTGKHIKPGKLGLLPEQKTPEGGGVEVKQVAKNSPAEKAGLQAKDVIAAVNGEKIADVMDLRVILGRHVSGDELTLKILRGHGKEGKEQKELDVAVRLSDGVDKLSPQKGKPKVTFKKPGKASDDKKKDEKGKDENSAPQK